VGKGEFRSVHGGNASCYCVQWCIKRFGGGLPFDLFEGKGKGCQGEAWSGVCCLRGEEVVLFLQS
jgi:hypothetical protein